MLIVNKNEEGSKLTLSLEGRLDMLTTDILENALDGALDQVEELVMDLKDLEYISSAGLRIFLKAEQAVEEKNGTMKIINLSDDVHEIFEITGFADVFTIE